MLHEFVIHFGKHTDKHIADRFYGRLGTLARCNHIAHFISHGGVTDHNKVTFQNFRFFWTDSLSDVFRHLFGFFFKLFNCFAKSFLFFFRIFNLYRFIFQLMFFDDTDAADSYAARGGNSVYHLLFSLF